jgi:hypothetical protein
MKHVQDPTVRRGRIRPGRGVAQRLALRVRVHVHRGGLDRQLADGLAPEAFMERAVRARQLADPATRRRTARSLRRLVKDAELPAAARLCSAVPVYRRTVLAWREALLGLAERLENPAPVNPCGVARTVVLLTDGAGPLYNPAAGHSMGSAVWWVADGLQAFPADDE